MIEAPGERVERCDNCEVALVGPFCHQCGQRDVDHLASVQEFFAHLLEVVAGYDSRLVRTLRALFLKPGLLTADYVAGRRARHLPPVQIYLISATLLFVSSSFNPIVTFNPTTRLFRSSLPTLNVSSNLKRTDVEALAKRGISLELFGERFRSATTGHLSTFLVLTVPLFTILLAIVFVGSGRPFGHHAVFALHWSAFYLTTLAALQLFHRSTFRSLLAAVFLIGIPYLYLLLALRRAYPGRWVAIVLRSAVLYFGYLAMLGEWLELVTMYTVRHI